MAAYQNLCVTLSHMSICARVVIAVTLQEIDNSPHAQTSAQGDHQSFHHINSGSKKSHMKYQNRSGWSAPVFPFLRILILRTHFPFPLTEHLFTYSEAESSLSSISNTSYTSSGFGLSLVDRNRSMSNVFFLS